MFDEPNKRQQARETVKMNEILLERSRAVTDWSERWPRVFTRDTASQFRFVFSPRRPFSRYCFVFQRYFEISKHIFFIHFPFPLPLVSRCRQKGIAGFEVIRGSQGGKSPEIRLDLDVAHRACRAIHAHRGGLRTRSERKLRRRRARRASVLPASWGVRRRRGGSRTELRRTSVPCIMGGGMSEPRRQMR